MKIQTLEHLQAVHGEGQALHIDFHIEVFEGFQSGQAC
jgi:hypothetical protein